MAPDPILGQILLGRYRSMRLLGSGAHGRVYLAEDLVRGGERVALKIVEGLLGGTMDDAGQRELRWFRHPAWAEILDEGRFGQYDWFQSTRYIEGKSLAALEGPQPIESIWRFLEDGARVLRALHGRGLIHYDVTPGNWLMETPDATPRFVLTDGGLAHRGPVQGFARGTPMYLAPELTQDVAHDHRVDLYSLGLVAYRLATGEDPHRGGAGDVLGQRRDGPAPHPRERRADLPAALDDLIAALLEPDPARRVPDAEALLARVLEQRPGTPWVRPAEAVAAATSGGIVGRDDVLKRFDASLRTLAEHLASPAGTTHPSRPAPEPVLLLEGPAGAGATRVARELAAAARREEIPVLLLAGREGAPDRRNPLRRLVDGLVTLQGPSGSPVMPAAIARRGEEQDTEAAAHADGRAIERFLEIIEETAQRTPLVLVVEDFPDLPPLAQEAVRVLTRHLLGRAERASGQAPLPLTVVVDLGTESADQFVNADAVDPRHALVTLAPLDTDAIATLCRERFPGLDLPQAGLQALLEASDGQPGHLSALLAEAYRRGDLRRDQNAWTWDLGALATYAPERGLPPALDEALHAASAPLRALLDRLALAESEIPRAAAHALWTRCGTGPFPTSRLISVREHGESVGYALATPALRRALLANLAPPARRGASLDLLAALEEHTDPRTLFDRIVLLVAIGRVRDALALAHAQRTALAADQRQALQTVLLRLVSADEALLADATQRAQISELLDRGTDGAALARWLALRLPHAPEDLPNVVLVARALDTAYDFVALEALLRAHASTRTQDAAVAAEIQVGLARALLALRRPVDAEAPLAQARLLLRRVRPRTSAHARLVVDYLKVLAHKHYDAGRLDHARRLLETARRYTRHMRARLLHVTVLNNLGLVQRAAGDYHTAARTLERALRLRERLGDITGAIGGLYNLGLLHLDARAPALAAARLQSAAGLAVRHRQTNQLVSILGQLGAALDQQRSTGPALACLLRGLRAGERCDQLKRAAPLAYYLAPLAAAVGDQAACRAALNLSARVARTRAFVDARGLHHLTMLATTLALGGDSLRRASLRRALRHARSLQEDARLRLALMSFAMTGQQLPSAAGRIRRPARTEPLRPALQLALRIRGSKDTPSKRAGRQVRWVAPKGCPAPVERLALEVLLRQYCAVAHPVAGIAWTSLATHFAPVGPLLLGARFTAERCGRDTTLQLSARAEGLSRALRALPLAAPDLPRALRFPACEFARALRAADPQCSLGSSPDLSARDLHAAAHALLLVHARPNPRDSRREAALRQVLAATSRMEPAAQLDALLDRLTRSTAEITGAQRACVVLVETEPPGQMRVATSITSAGGALTDQDLSHTVIRRVLASRKPLLLHDAFGDDELLSRPSITTLALRSILCVPMLRDGTLLGVMYADSSAGAGTFDQVDLEVLTLLADQAAAAIETNRLVSKLQRAYEEVRTMQDRLVKSERLRVLGEVSSGVAHEFNNLLTAILARVQLMGLTVPDREQRAHLALIEKATLDAAGVVRRLQTFSRQQRTNAFVPVLVAEVCTDAIEFLRPLWGTRRRHGRPPISVRLACPPGVRVTGNPTELREVLTNLIKNALDALSERGGTILVQVDRRETGIEICVQDDGPGIPAEILAKVFDPFFTTKGDGGTGLGLCLSQRIAEQHGGDLGLESTPGRGTSARLRLPLEAPAALPDAGSASGPKAQLSSRHLRVLVVDDDSSVLRPLCSYLERSGYEVASAKDGCEALAQVRGSAPDVLLTDIGMPNMDGLELCRQAMHLQPNLPVVLMSGWASEVDPAAARAAGAQALLAKPFAMQQVSELLASLAGTARPKSREA